MNCPHCGKSLLQQTKFCKHCGAQLLAARDNELTKLVEKRMDSEMEGLFWITVFGIGFVLGGMVVLKKFQLSDWLIVTYVILSSAAFITYFGLAVWQVRRLARESKRSLGMPEVVTLETNTLASKQPQSIIPVDVVPSVIETTTHQLHAPEGQSR